jgi:hypothetical protein
LKMVVVRMFQHTVTSPSPVHLGRLCRRTPSFFALRIAKTYSEVSPMCPIKGTQRREPSPSQASPWAVRRVFWPFTHGEVAVVCIWAFALCP